MTDEPQYVTSPALTMTHKPVRITAYAFGLVTILISGVVAVNVGAKYAYMTLFRHSPILTSEYVTVVWQLGRLLTVLQLLEGSSLLGCHRRVHVGYRFRRR